MGLGVYPHAMHVDIHPQTITISFPTLKLHMETQIATPALPSAMGAQTDTNSSQTNHPLAVESEPGSRRPQADTSKRPPSVDYRTWTYRGRLEGWWTCSVCGLSDRNIRVVTDHVMFSHVVTDEFKCGTCNTSYSDAQRLQLNTSLTTCENIT